MKIKTFIITFAGFLIILTGSIITVIYELETIRNMNMNAFTEKLYKENTKIMSEIIENIPAESYNKLKLPPSWAEIISVDSQNMTILASTNPSNMGRFIYSIPPILDQGKEIINRFKSPKPSVIETREHFVVIVPRGNNIFSVGIKPRKWEADLIDSQLHDLNKTSSEIIRNLAMFAVAGILFSIMLAYFISILLSALTSRIFKSFEELSLGNLDAAPPSGKGSEHRTFYRSFIRIRTTLKMALERLEIS